MKKTLADQQKFFESYFETLIHSSVKLVKDAQGRKLKIIVKYLKKFFLEKVITKETLLVIYQMFSAVFPHSNAYKEYYDILLQLTKSS